MRRSPAQPVATLPGARLPAEQLEIRRPVSFLDEWSRAQLVFFGGKGGVGKTTMAAAAGMAIARRSTPDGRRILVLSVDPAHSLGDSLGQPVGAKAVPVQDVDGLWAAELDAASLADAFSKENIESLRTLLDRGTLLDRSDINSLLDLTLPGVDEVMAVVEIARLLEEREWDLILVDTAPTGHALRFLAMPDEMKRWIGALDVMQRKYRYLRRHFSGRKRLPPDAAEQFLTDFYGKVEKAREIFVARDRAEFVPVAIAEPMAFAETERLLRELAGLGLHPKRLIVNQLIGPSTCMFCAARNRHQLSAFAAATASAHLELLPVPCFPGEVRGPSELNRVVSVLEHLADKPVVLEDLMDAVPLKRRRLRRPVERRRGDPLVLRKGTRFTFFGGKGGVGKTSLAAAAGLHLAGANPDKRVLLFSTDPAHSMADCFGVSLGPDVVPVAADNLFACEQDAEELFERFKDRYGHSITDIFETLTSSGVKVRFEKESMEQFASLSPPAVDEIMFLKSVMELAESGQFDRIVLDTAPTGHVLRFLELPELAHAWLRAIFKVLIKYGRTASGEMLDLARSLRRFQAVLTDAAQAEFVVVSVAEQMVVRESERLLEHLSRLGIDCREVVFNKLIPKSKCGLCRRTREVQEGHLASFRKAHPGLCVISAPLFAQPIAGLAAVRDLESVLFSAKGKR